MAINQYPRWKNLLIFFILLLGAFYALPNIYGEDPAVQISGISDTKVDDGTQQQVKQMIAASNFPIKSIQMDDHTLLIRLTNTDTQLALKDLLKNALGEHYSVALNLAPASPTWLEKLGGSPMKLGLDLRGGVHFALDVDIDSVISQHLDGNIKSLETELRESNIRYANISKKGNTQIDIQFRDALSMSDALDYLRRHYPDLTFTKVQTPDSFELLGSLVTDSLNELRQHAVEQTMTTLRNRVNELGVSEAMVQQQGLERIAVDLPGIQDTARAKEILGGTATLEFRLEDVTHDPRLAIHGLVPPGTKLYTYNNSPVLLKTQIILSGNSITDASTSYGEDGQPAVNIRLGGGGEGLFHRATAENVGKPLAIVYVETKTETQTINGKLVKIPHRHERVISIATIHSALPNNFQITGLRSEQEARDLALLLRAGALPAPTEIVEERTIGPQLGAQNIRLGIYSLLIGMSLIIVFMAFYYQLFGLFADIALLANLILLVAFLSLLGATLTLPGIAGIVLTVGMAVDANVLIFERIREEFRNGASTQSSIHAGYEKAFNTILDANITTLIVAAVLFGVGTGPVKGFAITLTLGLLTSMFTAILLTRSLVNQIYGGKQTKKLSIGL